MLRMKIAVLMENSETLKRFVQPLSGKFDAGLEIYAFTDKEKAINSLLEDGINLFLIECDADIKSEEIPKMCTLVYLSESDTVKEIKGVKTICLYHRPDTIYKELMEILYVLIVGMVVQLKINMKSILEKNMNQQLLHLRNNY